jgi:hypothetical protein
MAAKYFRVALIKDAETNCITTGDFAKKEVGKLAHQTQ